MLAGKERYIDPFMEEDFKRCWQFTLEELAEAAGIQPASIKRYCQRLKDTTDTKPLKADGRITYDAVERIMNPRGIARSPIRPPGWLTVKVLKDRLKASKNTIYRLIHTGELEGRNYKGTLYIDPEDAERLELQRKYQKPLIGWELITGVYTEAGRTQQALDAWIKRHRVPIRLYLHPHMNKVARFMPTDDAKAYRALAGKTGKYTPKAHLNPSLLEPPLGPTPHFETTQPAWVDIARPATHAEPSHQQHVSLIPKEERRAEQNPHPNHGDDGPRGLPHHHRAHPERSTPGGHHAEWRPRGPAHSGPS